MKRASWLLLVVFFPLMDQFPGVSSTKVKLIAKERDMILNETFVIKRYEDPNIGRCLAKCIDNCRCRSFQLCDGQCQLCRSNRLRNASSYHKKKGCTNFEFQEDSRTEQCGDTCEARINCCTKSSNVCLNGGKCMPLYNHALKRRFKCTCKNGYKGHRCGTKIRSCADMKDELKLETGMHTVIDPHNNLLQVFCDVEHEKRTIWTLAQSYEYSQYSHFEQHPYFVNKPNNSQFPSWKKYQLSRLQIKSIMTKSTKWRITFNYNANATHMHFVAGYVNGEINITKYNSGCVKVEYVNICHIERTNCSVIFKQSVDIPLCIACTSNWNGNCVDKLDSSQQCFAFIPNPTIQIWFGNAINKEHINASTHESHHIGHYSYPGC